MAEFPTMKIEDVVSSKQGHGFITIEGKRYNLFDIKNLKVNEEVINESANFLGEQVQQTRPVGVKLSGSMTVYDVGNYFDEYMDRFINKGKAFYFDLQTTNEDPTSGTGSRTTIYSNCCITKRSRTVYDVDGKYLEVDMDFAIGGVKRPQNFKDLDGTRV